MNYTLLNQTFQTICGNYAVQYTEGDIYQLNNKTNSYPAMNMSLVDLVQNKQNSEHYQVTLFYIDALNRDRSNKISIQSDGLEYLKTIVNTFMESTNVVVSLPVQYKAFTEKFTDECAGAFVTLRLEFLGECLIED